MKYLKHFANAQEAATILATWPFNTVSSIQGQAGASFSEGVPVGPVGPTDRVILKFMVTAEDWNEDAGKYKKSLIGENCGSPSYDGSCFDYMIKDNVKIDKDFWSMFIYFDTTGEHIVELVFDEEFDGNLPDHCFWMSDTHEVVIPSCVTSIGFNVFKFCNELTSVTISNSVIEIRDSAFERSGLTSVTIPNNVTSLGHHAFSDCDNLISVSIGSGVTVINQYTFSACNGLTSVNIPDGVTSISYEAFHGCSGLTSISIPATVTSIEYMAFYNCNGLASIICNTINPPYLGGEAFTATNNCPIYVPASSVDAYKAAEGWSSYASRIQAIQ